MAKAKDQTARIADPGWAALAEGRWDDARAEFEAQIAVSVSAEAVEGLSWAAWWLDDAEVVFDAREQAFRLYSEAGDQVAAARVATWLACDELDFHNAPPVAAGWLARAERLVEGQEVGPAHGWLAFFEGYLAFASDRGRAANLGRRAAEVGRQIGNSDLEMLGLALEGATLVAEGAVGEGMRRLDESTAVAVAGEAEVPISGAWACCFLVSACTSARDFARAEQWCERIEAFAKRYGSRYMLAFCRAEYGAIHLWHGRWRQAEQVLDESIDAFSTSRPAMVGGPLCQLAELRRRQGRVEEAAALLDRAGGSAAEQVCRARLALDEGDPRAAAEIAERSLRGLPSGAVFERAPALELICGASIAAGGLDRAAAAATELREIATAAGTEPMLACADLAAGLVAAARGDHDAARLAFEDAVDRFERSGGTFEAAEARTGLAGTLLALGRHEQAEAELDRAQQGLAGLGAVGADLSERGPGESDQALAALTPREREVLVLVAEGLTNREVAERLVLSEHTVHRHVTNLLRKLDLRSRTAAAALAARLGLLDAE